MNKKKIIFAIIGVAIIILLLIGLIFMKGGKKRGPATNKNTSGTFKIWIVGDKKINFEQVLTHFKENNKSFSSVKYEIESFPNYEEYSNALTSSIIKGVAPDLFVINNNERSIFEEKILAIPNDVININQFRKDYEGVFLDDLIIKTENKEDNTYNESLKGLAVGYETLGVFYNKRSGFSQSDFASFADLKEGINRVKRPGVVPIALGNGSTISNAGDIIAHFFLLKNIKSLKDSSITKDKAVLYRYTKYGSIESPNGYNKLYASAKIDGENDLELFNDEKVAAIVGFPRMLEKMKTMGFSRNLILVEPFPHLYKSEDTPTYVNYNYFAINKDTTQKNTAFALLEYLNSTEGSKLYLSKFKYYLPARTELVDELGKNQVNKFFNSIILKNFYPRKFILSSFDKGNKIIFDKEVKVILDDFSGYSQAFEEFKKTLLCKTNKILELQNLSVSCN